MTERGGTESTVSVTEREGTESTVSVAERGGTVSTVGVTMVSQVGIWEIHSVLIKSHSIHRCH